jgi:thioesterase domain-containing protein/acyl carrier protein
MVPSAFVVLERLPLTPNGKLDRKALPAPTTAGAAAYVAPATPAERAVVQVWQDVLRVERVGMHDSFFELGGHSLLATQLLGRLRVELGMQLSLKDIFEAQTPAGLVARADAPGSAPANPVRLRAGTSRPLFLVHAVGGGVSPYIALARDLAVGQAVFAFHAYGLDGSEAPVETIEALAARYVADLSTVQADGPLWIGGWSMGGVVAFEMARQLGSRVETLVLIDPPPPPSPGDAVPTALTWPVGEYLADLARSSATPLPFTALELEQLLVDPERDAVAIRAARRHDLIPRTLSDELLRARIAVFAANQRAVRRYVPRETIGANLILLACDGAAASWTPWVRGSVARETVSAETDHYSIVRVAGPYLRRLLRPR